MQVDDFQSGGIQAIFSFERPFSIIGDVELFGNKSVSRNVLVIEDSLLFSIPSQVVKDYGYDDPGFLRFINEHLRDRIYFVSSLLSQASQSVEFRLARYLIYRMEKEGDILQLEKRESLSALLGISVRHLNRTLKQMETMNIIKVQNKTLTIINSHSLFSIIK